MGTGNYTKAMQIAQFVTVMVGPDMHVCRQQCMCTSCSVQSISPSEMEEYTRAEYADLIFEYG